MFLRPNPNQEGSWFCDGSYDRLWAALQDLDLAVGFHPFLMPDMPGAVRQLKLNEFLAPGAKSIMEMTAAEDQIADGTYGNKNIFFTQALGNVFDMQIALTMLICGGVLERFPRLRCIFLEANGGWIVPILERLDHHYEIFRWEVPQLKMKPSEYFKRQCWISFDPDESTLKLTAREPARRRRPDHLGERLSAPRREDPGRRRRAARADGRPARRRAAADLRAQRGGSVRAARADVSRADCRPSGCRPRARRAPRPTGRGAAPCSR